MVDEQQMRSLQNYDPMEGNVLATMVDESLPRLAFPSGRLGCDLGQFTLLLDGHGLTFSVKAFYPSWETKVSTATN